MLSLQLEVYKLLSRDINKSSTKKKKNNIFWSRLLKDPGHPFLNTMDKYLVNGLIVLCLLISNVLQIQGYYSSTIVMHNNESDVEDLINLNYNINKNNRIDKTDEVFRHYRSDIKREPRFISFETRDDNIEVVISYISAVKFEFFTNLKIILIMCRSSWILLFHFYRSPSRDH